MNGLKERSANSMTDFSLVQEALEFMDHRRVGELLKPDDDNEDDDNLLSNNTANCKTASDVLEVNMFVLERQDQRWLWNDTSSTTTATPDEETKNNNNIQRERVLQNLACVGQRANQLLKDWNQRTCIQKQQWKNTKFPFLWNSGGDGPVFGVHVQRTCTNSTEQPSTLVLPYLHSQCHYGDTVSNEYLFLSLLFHLTSILSKEFPNFLIAVEALDRQDGQILLIEGANYIPTSLKPKNSQNRVWIVDGEIVLLISKPTSTTKKNTSNNLSRNNALNCLIQHFLLSSKNNIISSNHTNAATIAVISAPKEIKQSILCHAINFYSINNNNTLPTREAPSSGHGAENTVENPTTTANTASATMSVWDDPSQIITRQYMHYAPCVLPYPLAKAIRLRSDLTPCAVDIFCSLIDKFERQQQQSTTGPRSNSSIKQQEGAAATATAQEQLILPVGKQLPYTNLVVAVIPFSKVKYAILMAAGRDALTTSMMPQAYRSVEAARLRRILSNSDNEHLQDALEAGVRLTLGYEWLYYIEELKYSAKHHDDKTSALLPSIGDMERRVLQHWIAVDNALGGDGQWIYDGWKEGPNATNNCVSSLVNCPVYREEIQGNLCPLTFPNKTLHKQLHNLLERARKEEEETFDFPFPTKEQVDSDDWRTIKTSEMFENLMKHSAMLGGKGDIFSDRGNSSNMKDGAMRFHSKENRHNFTSSRSSSSSTTTSSSRVDSFLSPKVNPSELIDTMKQSASSYPNSHENQTEDDFFSDGENDEDSSSFISSGEASSDTTDSSSEGSDNEKRFSIRALMVST